ncbi:keratin, type II cytoskeletal 2 epidermal-like [Setaria italica]|uniref:keratin, type II cytoskeletal 2 epidermal-like n=1 Tax=Setaria italica TaxID=4555 RepID=UPI000BE5A436|nr:keratin, type II cytoskeletal 2 epidermal-like [Setaria italica]
MEPSSPRATAYGTSYDEQEKAPGLMDLELSNSLSPRATTGTSSDDSKYVEQMEIVDQVPVRHRTIRKSARGGYGQGRGSTATLRGTTIPKRGARGGRKGPPPSSSVSGSRSLPSSLSGDHGPPSWSSTGGHGAAPSSAGGSNGGKVSSAGGGQGGPPSFMGGGNGGTASLVGSRIKAPDAPSTKKRHLD